MCVCAYTPDRTWCLSARGRRESGGAPEAPLQVPPWAPARAAGDVHLIWCAIPLCLAHRGRTLPPRIFGLACHSWCLECLRTKLFSYPLPLFCFFDSSCVLSHYVLRSHPCQDSARVCMCGILEDVEFRRRAHYVQCRCYAAAFALLTFYPSDRCSGVISARSAVLVTAAAASDSVKGTSHKVSIGPDRSYTIKSKATGCNRQCA